MDDRDLPCAAAEDRYGFARRRLDNVQRVELIQVVTAEGAGIEGDPVHMVARYYTLDGDLVAVGRQS